LSYLKKNPSYTLIGVTEQASVNPEPVGFRDCALFIQSFQANVFYYFDACFQNPAIINLPYQAI